MSVQLTARAGDTLSAGRLPLSGTPRLFWVSKKVNEIFYAVDGDNGKAQALKDADVES